MKNTNLFEDDGSIDLDKIEDSKYLLDILLQCENVLDSQDTYVFRNWFEGEVIRGPIIRRHWVAFSLKYPRDKMPDPRAALRLLKVGVQVQYEHMKQEVAGNVTAPDHEPKEATDWMVTITIPRRLLAQTEEADLENYEDEINPDDVESAQDIGLDDETSYEEDEQNPDDGANPDGGDEMAPDMTDQVIGGGPPASGGTTPRR